MHIAPRSLARDLRAESDRARYRAPIGYLMLWGALVVGSAAWGLQLRDTNPGMALGAPPLFGRFDLRIDMRLLPAVALAVAALVLWPRIVSRMSWRTLLIATVGGAAAWAVALASSGGFDTLTAPLLDSHDYLRAVGTIESPGTFLRSFSTDLTRYPIHVQGHPPGMVLLLWAMARIGLGGAGPAAVLVIAAGASTVAAGLLVVRELAGERAGRTAAPFLVFAPAALWIATSADALFAGVGAWAVTLLVLASGRTGNGSRTLALTGGLLFGAALFLTYGAVLLASIPATVCVARRNLGPFLWGGLGIAVVALAFMAAGFQWFDGLGATLDAYHDGVSSQRPYYYFVLANLGAFALALGPAAIVGIAMLRDKKLWLVVGAALAAIIAADISGFSKGEVERIWLPFVAWIVIAASAVPRRLLRPVLASQMTVAIALQVGVLTPW